MRALCSSTPATLGLGFGDMPAKAASGQTRRAAPAKKSTAKKATTEKSTAKKAAPETPKPARPPAAHTVDAVGLRDRLSHLPSQLSGGQQQRAAVARALLSKPEIVFADEPTGNLDSKASAELLDFLRQAVDELDQTVVMVTHDPVAAGYSDTVLFLADGRIVDSLDAPTAKKVLDRLKALGE